MTVLMTYDGCGGWVRVPVKAEHIFVTKHKTSGGNQDRINLVYFTM